MFSFSSFRLKNLISVFAVSLLVTFSAYGQSCPAQGTQIFPELSGQELINALIQEYKTTTVLGYDNAREEMYGNIDNVGGFVEGIYTGYQGAIDPSAGSVRSQANSVNINAEHSWPQSKGATEGTNAHSDMHHLYPAFSSANSSRSNSPFYEIPDDETDGWWLRDQQYNTPVADSIDNYSERRDNHPNNAYSGSWEPRESVEGDIARSMFYFYTMYKNQADEADPIFFEVQKQFLRAWNQLDQVSTKEYNRTCAVAEFQDGKVNPFVIDPTLVDRAYFEGAISQTNVYFAASELTVREGLGTIQVEVAITNPNPDTATSVNIVYSGGSATAGDDFETFTSQTVTFPQGSLERQSVTLNLIDDDLEENEETILLNLEGISGPQNAVISDPESLEITIADNDGQAPSTAWINELHYDNEGTDEGEFVELAVNAEFADLTNVTITLYNGSNSSSYASYSGNDFVKGETTNGFSLYYLDLPSNGIQNGGPDGLSLDIDGELIQFLSYEGTFTAADGPAADFESIDIGVEETASTTVGSSLSLTGTGSSYADFEWVVTEQNTKGALNEGQEIQEPVSIWEEPEVASAFQLDQNYPNPFNPSTVIRYQLAENSTISLQVFDMLGREVASLANNEQKAAGSYQVTFDAGNLSSGVYIYRLSTSTGIELTKKMLLMK